MAKTKKDATAKLQSPVTLEMNQLDTGSTMALVGHPLHVMMVHFPVAFVFATLGIDLLYWWTGDDFWVRVGLWSAGMAFVSASMTLPTNSRAWGSRCTRYVFTPAAMTRSGPNTADIACGATPRARVKLMVCELVP